MKTLIIEDEKKNLVHLKSLLKQIPDVELLGEAASAENGKELIETTHPDLLLLDIELPDQNGFAMLQSIGTYDFDVIFITAYDQYGIQAVKCSALDYILKPAKLPELAAAIEKARMRKEKKQIGEQIQNLLTIVNLPPKEHRIAVQLMKEIRFLNPAEIIRCEASNNYTHLFLQSGEKLIASKGIYEFDEMLSPYHFIRCHQSHLVNRKYIKSMVSTDNVFELHLTQKDKCIPISRLKKEYVKKALI